MTTSSSSADTPTGLIGTKAAASLVGVDANTIKNWIKAGHIRGWLLNGRMWRVHPDEVLALVQPAGLRADRTGGDS
ncbi:helix-turn-helix domain-containing protein [Nocardia sp. NPDC046473]|uniref:helix-turn-helix domain-containing protein n=1 Tax=Nocardia sp. NPDC046473 TaxID=3155733 RepID=UPI0033F96FC1